MTSFRKTTTRTILILCAASLWAACSSKKSQPTVLGDCRPVDHVYDPATEPLRLPCEITKEECDGIDNDADGITDPHCGTVSCTSESDCTYGGLVPDADCNPFADGGPKCSQIDGVDPKDNPFGCWGMLCPPGLKCVEGGCYTPGTKGPGEPCDSGEECPIAAGCIPTEHAQFDTAICVYFCQDIPCPDGYLCSDGDNSRSKSSKVCQPEDMQPPNTADPPDGCEPDCIGKMCGPDGCGGACPDICVGECNAETGECSTE